jgi:hypothetical protein
LKGDDKAEFFNLHEITKNEGGARLGKTNQFLGTPAHPIENLMADPGAQNHKGKDKLKTNTPQNDFVWELPSVLGENKGNE